MNAGKEDSRFAEALLLTVKTVGLEFTFDDFRRAAAKVFGFDYKSELVKKYLNDLLKKGLIEKSEDGNGYIATYKLIEEACRKAGQKTLEEFISSVGVAKVKSFDELIDELEKVRDLSLSQFYALMERYGIDVARVIKKVALETDFFERNPVDLLIEFLRDITEIHNALYEHYNRETAGKKRDEIEKALKRLRRIVEAVFKRYLQVPVGDYEGAVIYLPESGHRPMEIVNESLLRTILERRIVDDRIVVEYEPEKGETFSGVDSSSIEVRPRLTRKVPGFKVFTTVVVILRSGDKETSAPVIRPTPEQVAHDSITHLEKEGYVIRGSDLLHYSDYYIDKISETQMQRLMYKMSLETLRGYLDLIPDGLYLDGRIWPTEHKLSDFFAEHKQYVRAMIEQFSNLVNECRLDGTPIVGIVKRGHLGFLWYLVFWYAYRHGIVDERAFVMEPELYESLENKDGAVACWLLILHHYRTGRYGRLFAVRRKLYASDDETLRSVYAIAKRRGSNLIDVENDYGFWSEATLELVAKKSQGRNLDALIRYLEGDSEAEFELPRMWLDVLRRVDEKGNLLRELKKERSYVKRCEIVKKYLGFDPLDREDRRFAGTLANVYAFGDVVSFYFLPPISIDREWIETVFSGEDARFEPGRLPAFSLPRIDLLFPVKECILLRGGVDRSAIVKLINSSLLNSESLDFYVWYETSEGVGWNLVVPAPVKLAHLYSKNLNLKDIAPMYSALLTAMVYRELMSREE